MDPNASPKRPSLLAAKSGLPTHERMLDVARPPSRVQCALPRLGPWWVAAVLLVMVGLTALALRAPEAMPAPGAWPAPPLATEVLVRQAQPARIARIEAVAPLEDVPVAPEAAPMTVATSAVPPQALAAATPVLAKAGKAGVARKAGTAAAQRRAGTARAKSKAVARARSTSPVMAASRAAAKTARAKPAPSTRLDASPARPAPAAEPRAAADPDAQLIGALMAHLERSSVASSPQARCTSQPRPAGCMR